MIEICATSQIWNELPLNSIQRKLYYLSESKHQTKLRWILEGMRFDSKFTKPADLSGWDIFKILDNSKQEIIFDLKNLSFFDMFWPKTYTYRLSNEFNKIIVSSCMINKFSNAQIEEFIWHELVHVAEDLSNKKFGHGNNILNGKEYTAPIKFSKRMASFDLPKTYNLEEP